MAEISKIAWTDGTFNPWIGCSRVSPGCENCYAENLMANRYGRVQWGPGKPRSRTKTWRDPVKWNKKAKEAGVRKRVFCASLADWLDEEVPAQWREDLFGLIESCRWIDWLMLTKRPQNAEAFLPSSWWQNPLPNVWFGVTAENQKYWDIRVPMLHSIPAAIRWVSYEPALGPLMIDSVSGRIVDWLIIGGESAQTEPARRFEIEWAESAVLQCRESDIIPFMKQTGSNVTYRGGVWSPSSPKDAAGTNAEDWPRSIQVQSFPASIPFEEESTGRRIVPIAQGGI